MTTYQAKKLALIRTQGNRINTHFVDMPRPMGLAYGNGRLSIGSGNQVLDYFNSKNAAAKLSTSPPFDGAFLPRRTHVTGDIDIHEMAYDGDGDLWIVNTKMSCLCVLDLNFSFVPKWKPPFISAYDATDRCHLNGLAMRDGKPKYVTTLGQTDDAAGWRRNKASGGIVMDIDTNQVLASGLSMPHSPRWYQDQLWVLESGAGALVTIDLESGKKNVIAEVPGFCRGIDFIGRYAVIGLSQIRETAMFAGLPLTKREEQRRCGIWIVDIQTGDTAGYLSFDSEIEEIFSVQCLPMAHPTIVPIDDEILDSSYSVPPEILNAFVTAEPLQIKIEQAREAHKQGQYDQAINLYRTVLIERPGDTEVIYNLGHALFKCGHRNEALECLDLVIAKQVDHAQAWNLRGQLLVQSKQFKEAIENFQQAISIDHQYALAHYHKACAELCLGNFKTGLADYDWRILTPGYKKTTLPHPKWQGQDIANKSLLVVSETNAADALLFARYLPAAKQKCGKLKVSCDPSLMSFFEQIECIDEIYPLGRMETDSFDVYAMIGSLGHLCATQAQTDITQIPYLQCDKEPNQKRPSTNSTDASTDLKVALVWSPQGQNSDRKQAEFTVEDFLGLSDTPGARLYSIQQGLSATELETLKKHDIADRSPEISDYKSAAELLRGFNLLISPASTLCHLAGALNIPTIVLGPASSDWRWSNQDEISYWYPSVTVLECPAENSTTSLMDRCKVVLRKIAQ